MLKVSPPPAAMMFADLLRNLKGRAKATPDIVLIRQDRERLLIELKQYVEKQIAEADRSIANARTLLKELETQLESLVGEVRKES